VRKETGSVLGLPVAELVVPRRVRLKEVDGCQVLVAEGPYVRRPVGPRLLRDFTSLEGSNDILAFAERSGVLGLCRHGLPFNHRTWASDQFRGVDDLCVPFEALEQWERLIGAFRALLKLGEELRRQSTGSVDDWAALGVYFYSRWMDWPILDGGGSPVSRRRNALADAMEKFLRIGQVRLSADWSGDLPTVHLRGAGLLGALALQAVPALMATPHDVVTCSHCLDVYLPQRRRPKRNQRNFCPACRAKHIPERLAGQDYRSRQRIKRVAGRKRGS
jgi:hypothetical protein